MSVQAGPLRWRLWRWLTKLPTVCPAQAHSVLITRTSNDPRIDAACRRDVAANGVCWCGKLRAEQTPEATS